MDNLGSFSSMRVNEKHLMSILFKSRLQTSFGANPVWWPEYLLKITDFAYNTSSTNITNHKIGASPNFESFPNRLFESQRLSSNLLAFPCMVKCRTYSIRQNANKEYVTAEHSNRRGSTQQEKSCKHNPLYPNTTPMCQLTWNWASVNHKKMIEQQNSCWTR